ncbi:hypothetical protein WN55_01490 [Dufourea novaeangliae]|uniref:Uncharacterized protein n=1 Tax=Dufourea novaeangliae TaxID=178035 RepID=A0A154PG09_DUFNO|nr:hypothetical protein WN55_01490 [Dufourea novaeangliae]
MIYDEEDRHEYDFDHECLEYIQGISRNCDWSADQVRELRQFRESVFLERRLHKGGGDRFRSKVQGIMKLVKHRLDEWDTYLKYVKNCIMMERRLSLCCAICTNRRRSYRTYNTFVKHLDTHDLSAFDGVRMDYSTLQRYIKYAAEVIENGDIEGTCFPEDMDNDDRPNVHI